MLREIDLTAEDLPLYGRSPAMNVLPDLALLVKLHTRFLAKAFERAEMKRAYAELADW
jgi:hypothetical protein